EQIKKDHADVPVVMISGHGNIETAVAAIKRGAYDFIEKPFKSDRLVLVATRALETSRLKREVKELKQLAPTASVLTGRSACMNQLRQTIDRAAKANSRILIVGPSGSGKELAARTLHNASGRAEGPFVVINAAAITPERMEVELFGIEHSNGEQARKPGVLQSHVWPGNVRQLRNNVERVMILAGGGPEAIITADMLPQDVGSMVPAMPTSNNGEHIMGLPLREAREVFERDYLIAQISRFSGNISRTAEFVGMERSALHRKLKALGVG